MRYEIRTDLGVKLDVAPTFAKALTAAAAYGGVIYDSRKKTLYDPQRRSA